MTEQAVGCRHAAYRDTSHCGEMSCKNYIGKCLDKVLEPGVDVQTYPDKIYFQYTDLDRDEPDLQQNCAISYDDAADLWQKLRAAWLTQTGYEDLTVLAEAVLDDDVFQGFKVMSTFHDLEHVTIHLDNYGKLILPMRQPLEIMRRVR